MSYLRRIKVLAARPRGRSLHPAIELLEDRTTPAVSTPILVATSDTGFSSTDRLTMDNTPTFTGTATPGVAVQLREESAILGSATANAAGNWTITTIVLTNGVHDIFARDNTNSINSATVDVTIDTLAPAVSLADLDPLSDNGFSNSDNITNDNTPTFSGSAEAGATVQLREGSTLHGSTFGSSSWSITTLTLSSANHSIFVRVIDGAGNQVDSPNLTVTIDTSAPAVSAPDLDASSDSGSSSTDNITNDNTPLLRGTAQAGALVELFEGSTLIGSTTASGGNWTITAPTLAEGVHTLFARATEAAGNFTNSASLNVTIDTIAPTITDPDLDAASDSGPSDSDNITNDATPTFRGTADAGLTVQLREGTTVLGSGVATNGVWVITPGLADGAHTVFARVTDPAGNFTSSATLNVTIDTVVPSVSDPDLDSDSDHGFSNVDNLTNDDTPTFRGTADAGVTVELLDGATVLGTTTASAEGAWVITTTPLLTEVNNISARATDAAGNVATSAAALTVTLDLIPPAVSVPDLDSASDSGLSNGDNITNDNTPTFSGTADADLTVELRQGSTVLGSVVATGGVWVITTGTLADGGYSIVAWTMDAAGNTVQSAALSVTIDTTAPILSTPDLDSASDSGVSSSDNLTNDATPTLRGSVEAGISAELLEGTTVLGAVSGNWATTLDTLSDGAHNFFTRATDVAGNMGSSAVLAITIDTAPPAVSAPDLTDASDLGPSSTDNITADATPTFTGTAETGATVELRSAGSLLQSTTAAAGAWTMTSPSLADGVYQVFARAVDAAGNVTDSANLSLTINTSTPDLDAASDSGILNSDNVTSDPTPTFSGTAFPGVTVELREGTTLLGTAVATGGTWSITSSALADGVHTIFARVLGTGGHDSPTLTVTIDTTPTAVTINQAAAQADPTTVNSIQFTVVFSTPVTGFTATDVVLGGTAGAANAAVNPSAPLDGTTYTVVVTGMTQPGTVTADVATGAVEDVAGNDSLPSTSTDNEVTYQFPPPTVTIDQAAGQADPTGANAIQFTVVFSTAVTGFDETDVVLGGTAGASTGEVSESGPLDGTTYTVVVTGMTQPGTVTAHLAAGAAQDEFGSGSLASTSSDNQVTYQLSLFAVGQGKGGAGLVQVLHAADQAEHFSVTPYAGFTGDIRVAMGDVNHDGTPDLITAPGRGWQGQVRVYDGVNGMPLARDGLLPFGGGWKRGLFVAAGDTNSDGFAEIIVGQDQRGGRVRIFDGATGGLLKVLNPFGGRYRGGVTVAAGDIDLDGKAEVFAGRLGGPTQVRLFKATGARIRTLTAFPGLKLGVNVAAGDVNGDGRAEVIASLARGQQGLVKVFNASTGGQIVGTAVLTQGLGVRVAAVDTDSDGLAEVVAAAGPGGGPHVKVLNGLTLAEVDSFFAAAPEFSAGFFVG